MGRETRYLVMCMRPWNTFATGSGLVVKVKVNPGDPVGWLPVYATFEDALKFSEGDCEIVPIEAAMRDSDKPDGR